MPFSNGSCNGTSGISLAGSREDTGIGRGDAMSISEDRGPADAAADAATDAVVVTVASASFTDTLAATAPAPGGLIFGDMCRPRMAAAAATAASAAPSKAVHTAAKATKPSWKWRAKGSGGTDESVGKRGG
jgi:hypothetical protein